MKKKALVFALGLLFLFGLAVASSGKTPKVEIPKHAVKLSQNMYDLGTVVANGKAVHGYLFIHYKDEFSHKPNHNGGGSSTGCFTFLSQGARWKATEPYVLDAANGDSMNDSYVDITTGASLDAWDSQAAFEIFGNRDTTTFVDGADTSAPDNKNEIYFGDIAEPGAIAVTIVWGIFSGPPQQRQLVEFDAVFDDPDYLWGNADANPAVMDYWNIAAHELGHAAGMGHPSDGCTEETMYRFGQQGETKKRTLNAGDIAGIKKLYK